MNVEIGATFGRLTVVALCGCLQAELRKQPDPRAHLAPGARFGRLIVLRSFGPPLGGPTRVDVRCDCGIERTVNAQNLKRGLTKSCGCLMRQRAREANVEHGRSRTREHIAWLGAKARCFNPKNQAFADYGGRGITMSATWRNNFEAFLLDMGSCPHGATLDRENNDGNYEPGNCRWATPKQQANNRRSNRIVEVGGVARTLTEWADATGLAYDVIKQRLNKLGWTPARAVSEPVRRSA